MDHRTNETLRKSIHIAFGFGALALRFLDWRVAAAVAGAAVIANWLLLHRIVGKRVARHERGWDAGIVIYPLAVLVAILVFRSEPVKAAIIWAILAFGDGFASVVGRTLPIARLPWNAAKSWGGFLTFIVAGVIAVFAVTRFFGAPCGAIVIAAVIVAAIVESLPLGVDDNIVVPLAAAVTLLVLAKPPLAGGSITHVKWGWLAINVALAVIGYLARSVDLSGAIGGWLLGTIIILGAGSPLYAALLTFFILGTAATKLGYARKARMGLAQEKGGRRGASHAFSNVGVAAICAIASWRNPSLLPLFMGMASLATAAADTTASEIGQLLGRRTFLPLTLRRVEPGTEGAISLEGTLAGIVAGVIVAAVGTAVAVHHIRGSFVGAVEVDKAHAIITLTVCAFLGSYLESIVGSWNRKQPQPIPNGVLNFFNTAAGALLFAIAAQHVPMFGYMF